MSMKSCITARNVQYVSYTKKVAVPRLVSEEDGWIETALTYIHECDVYYITHLSRRKT